MFNFALPLTVEEQTIMLLYQELEPHIKNTIGDAQEVQEVLVKYVHRLAEVMQDKPREELALITVRE